MKIENVKIGLLKPAEYNPRKWNQEAIDNLKKSIERFGIVDPIIVNSAPKRKNVVIGGHFRLKIAKDLGYKEVPVVYINIPDIKKEQELNLRLNKNLGEWDNNLLAKFDKELLLEAGFELIELDDIFGLAEGKTDPDDIPEIPKKAKSKLGDIYKLGRHRLLCGDCTIKENAEKLMDGKKADVVFTDPPYGVDYASKNKFLNAVGKPNCIEKDIEKDNLKSKEIKDLWSNAWKIMIDYINEGGSFYICSADSDLMMMMMMSISESGLLLKQSLVWVKNNIVLGRRDYKCKHENILYGWKKGTHRFYGKAGSSSVFEYDKPLKNDLHPTMKPIALIENIILNSSKMNDIVLDTFGGSGSTLISCEQTERVCYMMEIDPLYIDVIIERWEKFTGKKAEKV